MQKWLNDLYAVILKNGFNPDGGSSGGGSGGGSGGVLVGNYLGDTYTDEQKQAIANGSFDGLNIGDYWIINDITWRIADFDYYYNVGDTAFTKHHLIIVPDSNLYNDQINEVNRTNGGFLGSVLAQNLRNGCTYFFNAFGEAFIPYHKFRYSNGVTDGVTSSWTWTSMCVGVMTEEQVYGNSIWGAGNGFDVGTQKTQFRLFSLDKTKINTGNGYWLSNIKSSTNFCCVGSEGDPRNEGASKVLGIRLFACLIGDPE